MREKNFQTLRVGATYLDGADRAVTIAAYDVPWYHITGCANYDTSSAYYADGTRAGIAIRDYDLVTELPGTGWQIPENGIQPVDDEYLIDVYLLKSGLNSNQTADTWEWNGDMCYDPVVAWRVPGGVPVGDNPPTSGRGTTYQLSISATGRASSTDPNLSNTPKSIPTMTRAEAEAKFGIKIVD